MYVSISFLRTFPVKWFLGSTDQQLEVHSLYHSAGQLWAKQFCSSASGARYPSVWIYFTSWRKWVSIITNQNCPPSIHLYSVFTSQNVCDKPMSHWMAEFLVLAIIILWFINWIVLKGKLHTFHTTAHFFRYSLPVRHCWKIRTLCKEQINYGKWTICQNYHAVLPLESQHENISNSTIKPNTQRKNSGLCKVLLKNFRASLY